MRVFCTGVAGSDKKSYLEDTIRLAETKSKKVKLFSTGTLMKEHFIYSGIINNDAEEIKELEKYVLDYPESTLKSAAGAVFHYIKDEISDCENAIINSHARFLWNKYPITAHTPKYLNDLDIDLFVTVIDYEEDIKKRLDEDVQWSAQKLSIEEILDWQADEILDTRNWAKIKDKPHFIVPRKLSDTTLYKLMFHPHTKKVYLSFPMTFLHNDIEANKKIDDFSYKLNERFIVINPKSTELTNNVRNHTIDEHTVYRDEKIYVGQSNITVAYFPSKESIVYASGVDAELNEAFKRGKEVWIIWPNKNFSPFVRHYTRGNIVSSEEQFWEEMDKRGYRKIEL